MRETCVCDLRRTQYCKVRVHASVLRAPHTRPPAGPQSRDPDVDRARRLSPQPPPKRATSGALLLLPLGGGAVFSFSCSLVHLFGKQVRQEMKEAHVSIRTKHEIRKENWRKEKGQGEGKGKGTGKGKGKGEQDKSGVLEWRKGGQKEEAGIGLRTDNGEGRQARGERERSKRARRRTRASCKYRPPLLTFVEFCCGKVFVFYWWFCAVVLPALLPKKRTEGKSGNARPGQRRRTVPFCFCFLCPFLVAPWPISLPAHAFSLWPLSGGSNDRR